jgi:hypothetical protein
MDRGQLQEGASAELMLFDPKTISRADSSQPLATPWEIAADKSNLPPAAHRMLRQAFHPRRYDLPV